MAIDYSNLPIPDKDIQRDSSDDTIKFFDAYNKKQLQFKASEGDAVIAFFQSSFSATRSATEVNTKV